jgi:hypothetical protein
MDTHVDSQYCANGKFSSDRAIDEYLEPFQSHSPDNRLEPFVANALRSEASDNT